MRRRLVDVGNGNTCDFSGSPFKAGVNIGRTELVPLQLMLDEGSNAMSVTSGGCCQGVSRDLKMRDVSGMGLLEEYNGWFVFSGDALKD